MKLANILCAATVLSSACSGSVLAGDLTTIALHNGSNAIHLSGDGAAGMALLGRRENFNAHGFDVLTLYLKGTASPDVPDNWHLVSIFDSDKEALTLTAGGGADCMLHDFRLVRQGGREDASLIVADRDFGSTYVDAAPVHFKFYALRRNDNGDVGRPLYYFELIKQATSKKVYCDVGEALLHELAVKPYRQ